VLRILVSEKWVCEGCEDGGVLHADAADLAEGADHVEAELEGIGVANHFHDHVRTTAAGGGFDLLDGVVVEVDGLRAQLLRLGQALWHGVDGVDGVHHGQGARDGADAHRPTSHDDGRELLAVPLR
jgi:hypothetical protein